MNEHSSGTRAEVPPSATDSGTPRVDAIISDGWMMVGIYVVSADFARQLEREVMALRQETENLKDALVYSAFMQHETKLHMLPANMSLINNDWVKVWLRDSVVDTGPRPNAFSKLATGTDKTRSGDQINPDGADQGSVRNATDREVRMRTIRIRGNQMKPVRPCKPNDCVAELLLQKLEVSDAALVDQRSRFQNETRRTSELAQMLIKFVKHHQVEHGPGLWSRSCELCALVGEAEALLFKPINTTEGNARESARDAGSEMRERCARVCDEEAVKADRAGYIDAGGVHRTDAKLIRALPDQKD